VHPRAKVTIDNLQEIVYEESIATKMNDLDLYRGRLRSCHHRVTFHWISRKPLERSLVPQDQ